MTSAKTSLAWQGFRQANLVSTSTPTQDLTGRSDDSDGAKEDGFVGAGTSGSRQDMMMEIMDKYIEAGEALAEKENDARQLKKQVKDLKAANSELEGRTLQLKESNEKLADDEGRWYSLARELESQMGVIKKGETYSLFEDKVDEAEARLEVAAEAAKLYKRRLYEVYGVASEELRQHQSSDQDQEQVDEHCQHATFLAQVKQLKSSTVDMKVALAASVREHSAADLKWQHTKAVEAELRNNLEGEVLKLKKEAVAQDSAAQFRVDACREAAMKQSGEMLRELELALEEGTHLGEVCRAATAAKKAAEEAQSKAAEAASTVQASLGIALGSLNVEKEETRSLKETLAFTRSSLKTLEEEVQLSSQAQHIAETNAQQSLGRIAELEKLLQEAQSRLSEIESDLKRSLQQIVEMAQAAEKHQEDITAAVARTHDVQANEAAQKEKFLKSLERVGEVEALLQATRLQLEERNAAVVQAQGEATESSRAAQKAREEAEDLRQELERVIVEASAAQEYAAQAKELRHELATAQTAASTAQEDSALAESLRKELEKATSATSSAQNLVFEGEGLRQDLDKANAALRAAQKNAELAQELRQDLENASAAAVQELALETEELRQELERAKVTNTDNTEGLRVELNTANAAAVSAQKSAARTQGELKKANTELLAAQHDAALAEGLRQELDCAKGAAAAVPKFAAESESLRQKLERVKATLVTAQKDAERANQASMVVDTRVEALASSVQAAEQGKIDAEAQLEALQHIHSHNNDNLFSVENDAAIATQQALSDAREDVLRAETRATEAEQISEESLQQIVFLSDNVRGLEAQLAEATGFVKQSQHLDGQHRENLASFGKRVDDLEKQLATTRAQLEAAHEDARGADVLFASPASGYDDRNHGHNGDANTKVLPTTTNGEVLAPPTVNSNTSNAEVEQLQAHAEAMELELRYTLESFEGQLSAMAREKVAIQRQAKELTGQCSTLRKQASHYKKVARESEAQLEDILELQQQLCDAESAVEKLRTDNTELASKIELLEANANLWEQCQGEVGELERRLAESDGVRAKANDTWAKEITTLENKVKDRDFNLLRFRETGSSNLEELVMTRAHAMDVEERLGEAESEALVSMKKLVASQEALTATSEELALVKARVVELKERMVETEAGILELKDLKHAKAEKLAEKAKKAQSTFAKVVKLKILVADLKDGKQHLAETVAALTSEAGQVRDQAEEFKGRVLQSEEVIRSLEGDKRKALQALQKANEARAKLGEELAKIRFSLRCEVKESNLEKLRQLKSRLEAAEDLLGATKQALEETDTMTTEEGTELESGESESSWVLSGVKNLQRRLQLLEFKLSESAEASDDGAKALETLEGLSVELECDRDRVKHKVHDLNKLTHELLSSRNVRIQEIQNLKEKLKENSGQGDNSIKSQSAMFPEHEVAAAREKANALQVTIKTLKHELVEAQQMRAKDIEKHRGEEMILQERYEALSRSIQVGASEGSISSQSLRHGLSDIPNRKAPLHRKSSSFTSNMVSSATNWLAEERQGQARRPNGISTLHSSQANGNNRPWGETTAQVNCQSMAMAENGGDGASDDAEWMKGPPKRVTGPEGSETACSMLAKVEAKLGCKAHEVVEVLDEQQSVNQQHQIASKILGDVKHSYLRNMGSLASAVGHEAALKVSPLLVQASDLCSKRACLTSNEEGLEVLDKVTSILSTILSGLVAKPIYVPAEPGVLKVALQLSQGEVTTLNQTLRKERLMMMAFRRWGHFYLALSNQALRKRTKERNQARAESHTLELDTADIPVSNANVRGKSRARPAGRIREQVQVRVNLSSEEIEAMVEQEAERVARELAEEPSSSLLALHDARREMDDIAMRAQATLSMLYAEPPQDISYAQIEDVGAAPTIITMPYGGNFSGLQQCAEVKTKHFDDAASLSPEVVAGSSTEANERNHQEIPPMMPSGGKETGQALPAPPIAMMDDRQHQPQGQAELNTEATSQTSITEQAVQLCVSQEKLCSSGEDVVVAVEGAAPPLSAKGPPLLPPVDMAAEVTVQSKSDEQGKQELDKLDGPAEQSEGLTDQMPTSTTSPPPITSPSTPPPLTGLSNGAGGPNSSSIGVESAQVNALKGRTTGPLVEDGISKAERAEFLRKQREERKANRKKGIRASSTDPAANPGLRNRRTSAPAMMSNMRVASSGPIAPPKAASPALPASTKVTSPSTPPVAPMEDNCVSESNGINGSSNQLPSPLTSACEERDLRKGEATPAASPGESDRPPTDISTELIVPPVAAPPPRMFNPTAVPPPTAPPTAAATGQVQAPRHPSIAFSVNETVEKALAEAKRNASLMERKARFWKCRFREVALWAATFAVLSYASDHGFEDC